MQDKYGDMGNWMEGTQVGKWGRYRSSATIKLWFLQHDETKISVRKKGGNWIHHNFFMKWERFRDSSTKVTIYGKWNTEQGTV